MVRPLDRLPTLGITLVCSLAGAGPAAARTGHAPYDGPCEGVQLPRRAGPSAFESGEQMAFDVKAGFLHLGRMNLTVGPSRQVGQHQAIVLTGQARTSMVASSVQRFEGRWMSLVDSERLLPLGMQTESRYGEDPRRERARFSGGREQVEIDYFLKGREGVRRYDRERQVFDLLSLLFYARNLELRVGERVCQEVVADRRLWRMEAKTVGRERVQTPLGRRWAYAIDISFDRIPHPDFNNEKRPHFDMKLYLSDDSERLPLTLVIETELVNARAELVRHEA